MSVLQRNAGSSEKIPDILDLVYEGAIVASNDYANYFRWRSNIYRASKTTSEVVKMHDKLVKLLVVENRNSKF